MRNIINNVLKYVTAILWGCWHLVQGMYVTMRNFLRRKVTEQYPENRGKKVYFERTRGHLVLDVAKCTSCGLCAMQCPNGSIEVVSRSEEGKKVLDKYIYNLGSCTFCSLCTNACPTKAIGWTAHFEDAVFDKTKLTEVLN